MNPFVLTTLISSLGLGTAITFSSSHWLLAWMGLEINTLAILPIMSNSHHPRAVEATTKYFITQATAAALILFASTTNAWMTGEWDIKQMTSPTSTSIATMALALKLGLAPVHFWLPEVLQGLDLTTGLILSTWQKLAPLALIVQMPQMNPMIMTTLGFLSMLVGGWGGLNQTQLRKILAYSSIAHLGWMVIVVQFDPLLTLLSLALYISMTTSAFMTMNTTNSKTMNSLANSWSKSPAMASFFPLIMLSLAGLPPLSGFMPKWLILQELTKQHLPFIATLSALSALISLYFYLRLTYAMTLTQSPNTTPATAPWRLNTKKMTLPLAAAISLTTFLLPLTPTIQGILH
uniref:NADH dehydrogenase subunit 2 n=1 Tax=Synodus macrops TaxID=1585515 RepID=UPI0028D723D0|nr:NADH dehydrogenase subunit 2 [Synodus macrops]WMY89448.1 NADH dehydrogenase subunit 2 [Synodus macrops]